MRRTLTMTMIFAAVGLASACTYERDPNFNNNISGGETGDGDGDCTVGAEDCPCTAGGGCDPGLTCEQNTCMPGDGDGDGDGDCKTDVDCVDDPAGPVCDPETGDCMDSCEPNEVKNCYSGPEGTVGNGPCTAGTTTCRSDGMGFGPCMGEVLPQQEDCSNGVDDDCNTFVDDGLDEDGDGFGTCGGDCCDTQGEICSQPELINPGAFEVVGNGLDDDCDGVVDEAEPTCDDGLLFNTQDPLDFAKAIDLCQFTEENPANSEDRIWGVIEGSFTLANQANGVDPLQYAVTPMFGMNAPRANNRLIALSSGTARDADDVGHEPFEPGKNYGSISDPPASFLSANGGSLPNVPGCPEGSGSGEARDSAMLTLKIRVPTNARSFTADVNFFSAEFPEWVCSNYNDMFVALVDSSSTANPADGNIAIYDDGTDLWPLGINLTLDANGLFTQCVDDMVGCRGAQTVMYDGCTGTDDLIGTGFDAIDMTGNNQPGCNAVSGGHEFQGGATGWLEMAGNVEPGEVMEVRFAVWDSGGHIYDALVLIDNWQWDLDASEPGVAPAG